MLECVKTTAGAAGRDSSSLATSGRERARSPRSPRSASPAHRHAALAWPGRSSRAPPRPVRVYARLRRRRGLNSPRNTQGDSAVVAAPSPHRPPCAPLPVLTLSSPVLRRRTIQRDRHVCFSFPFNGGRRPVHPLRRQGDCFRLNAPPNGPRSGTEPGGGPASHVQSTRRFRALEMPYDPRPASLAFASQRRRHGRSAATRRPGVSARAGRQPSVPHTGGAFQEVTSTPSRRGNQLVRGRGRRHRRHGFGVGDLFSSATGRRI